MDPSARTPTAGRARFKRAAFRFRLPGSWARYSLNGVEGRAEVSDVSTTGVRLDRPSHPLASGTVAQLALLLAQGRKSIDVAIEVARQTQTGFAGRFIDVGPNLAKQLATELNQALKRYSRTASG